MTADVAVRGHLATLTEASVTLAGAGLDTPVVLDTVTDLLVKHVGGSAVAYLLTEDGTGFELAAVSSSDPAVVLRVQHIEAEISHPVDGDGLLARCARSGGPLRLAEADASTLTPIPAEYRDTLAPPSLRSLLFVPLISDGELLGVLVVSRVLLEGTAAFDDAEVDLACDLAELATRALSNARLHRALALSTELFETAFMSAPIGMALVSANAGPDLGRLLWVNTALVELSGHDEATLATLPVQALFPEAVRPRIEADLAAATEYDMGDSIARGRLLRSDGTVIEVRIDARAIVVADRPVRLGLLQVHPVD